MNIICKIVFGSQLYGTATPQSDQDFRGIFLPTREECFLNRIKDSVNDLSEEDTQYWSLQYFLRLASEGQSAAIELLAAPQDKIVINSDVWGGYSE